MIADRALPKSIDDLAEFIGRADREGNALTIEGGATLSAMGAPSQASTTVSLTKLNRLLAHEYHDLTCSVQAGMTLASFAAKLRERGQFVALDAPLARKATVGGTLASGWLGPRRHLFGRSRDFTIGSKSVLADGSVVSAGGMVVKNVSGYDMSKLYIGSFGTLCAIVQANFKTLPLPQRSRALIARLPENTRERAIVQLRAAAVIPSAAYCIEGYKQTVDGEDSIDGRIYVLLEGSELAIDRATRDLRSALGRAGVPETTIVDNGAHATFERLCDAPLATLGERSLTYRSLGSPATAHERAIALRDAANAGRLYTDTLLDAMNGDVFIRIGERDARAFAEKAENVHDALRAIDPRSVIVAGAAPIRSGLDAWGEPPQAIGKMIEIKHRFDPNGVLNPGRFVGGI